MKILRLVLALLLVVPVATAPASAGAPREREVEAPYKTPVLGVASEGNRAYYFDCRNGIGCAILPLERRDRYATIRIEDTLGLPVHGEIFLMPGNSHLGEFCGEAEDVPVHGAAEVLVHVQSGTCSGMRPSIATTGVVSATIRTRK